MVDLSGGFDVGPMKKPIPVDTIMCDDDTMRQSPLTANLRRCYAAARNEPIRSNLPADGQDLFEFYLDRFAALSDPDRPSAIGRSPTMPRLAPLRLMPAGRDG